jgi:N-acyl homoserine lactone hydrolase
MPRIAPAIFALILYPAVAAARPPRTDPIRVYALDCGHATLDDGALISDTGEVAHEPIYLADPCFVVRHPRGWLLWDAGLGNHPPELPGLHVEVGPAVERQLEAIGASLDAVTFIAFSHLHFDHVGSASLFVHSTWIMSRDEVAWAEHEPAHVSMLPELFAAYHNANTVWIERDHDVFGDGRVRILSTPGHTPGSAVLFVELSESGPLILSGDLYVSRYARRFQYVPTVNVSRAETLASMARIERIAKRSHARLIIQHDPDDYAALPKPPAFLQ